jgi:hypothetical protein
MSTKLRNFVFPVCIRYDNVNFADGFGAQAIRLIGIFSIAQRYRLRYEHRDLRFDHPDELLGPHSSQENYLLLLKDILFLMKLPNTGSSYRKKKIVISMRTITRRVLIKLILKSLLSNSEIVINLQLPQGITDYHPEILELGAQVIRKNLSTLRPPQKADAIVIHVRTGNHTVKTPRFNALPQLTPAYYNEALNMVQTNEMKRIIHTDLFPIDILNDAPSLRFEKFRAYLEEASKTQSTQILHYAPILSALGDMATAKVLVMSNSALSYFAGLMNINTVIWPPIHGHAKLKRWFRGPDLTPESLSFVDNTNYLLHPDVDHTIYRSKFDGVSE